MVAQHQHFKLQMQPQAVSGYDLSLSKVTFQSIFVSADLAPDLDTLYGNMIMYMLWIEYLVIDAME